MNGVLRSSSSTSPAPAVRVAAGEDRFGEKREIGIGSIAFKVSTRDSSEIFILENSFLVKGGPSRHLHYDQDEWFYCIEGEFVFEVGRKGRD